MTYQTINDISDEVRGLIQVRVGRGSGLPFDQITEGEREQYRALMNAMEGLLDGGHGLNCIEAMVSGIIRTMGDPRVYDNYPREHHNPQARCFHGVA